VLDTPPSLDAREITDKGSLNQKSILRNRAAQVEELYATSPPAHVFVRSPAGATSTRTS
jgi:feruloyl-CoA synthase